MLEKMTESLFAETLKRIAEDVWRKKFEDLAQEATQTRYDAYSKLNSLMTDVFMTCVKDDAVLREKIKTAISEAAHAYFERISR